MTEAFNIQLSESQKLLFVWYLLFQIDKKQDDETLIFGKNFLDVSRYLLEEVGIVKKYSYDFEITIDYFLEIRIIDQVGVIQSFYDKKDESDEAEPVKEKFWLIAPKKPQNLSKKLNYQKQVLEFLENMPEEERFENYEGYFFNINKKNAREYIEKYLELWSNDDLYLSDYNIYRKEFQIQRVVETIFQIIEKHSHKNMLLGMPDFQGNREIDFAATIVFLEKTGNLKLHEIVYGIRRMKHEYFNKLFLRITLTEKFFENFILGSNNEIYFDFKNLKSNKTSKKIYFDKPFRLWNKNTEYRLNRGKVPYELMNNTFKDNFVQSIQSENLQNNLKISEKELDKSLKNFRASLREKFKFPESETFFDIQDGEIKLKANIFTLKDKKD